MGMKLFRRTLSTDCLTPPAVFSRVVDRGDCFLFESAEGGEQWGRYSMLGISPATVATFGRDGHTRLRHRDGRRETLDIDILQWLRQEVIRQQPLHDESLPFSGGAVGYFGYPMVSHFEAIPDDLPDPIAAPIAAFLLVDRFMIFDNLKGTLTCCVRLPAHEQQEAEKILDRMEQSLREGEMAEPLHLDIGAKPSEPPTPQMSQQAFEAAVARAREYIHAGDIFQVVLSQRFSKPLSSHPFDVYRAVRHINPSPYLFYLHIDDLILVGSSPEILVRKDGRDAVVRPIAGTRPRGHTRDEDRALEKELLADEKERAEHVMLVDLGRNDLGRVCEYGTVHVTDSMVIERYSHVMHIVSQVEGRLRPDCDAIDLLAATFPAGTVSGAPKVRAMEIIHELEPVCRGPYAGTVGYIDFGGEHMDTAIAIRTAIIRQGRIHIQSGAGIVADSVPVREHRECVNKAMAMFRAVALAEAQAERQKR